MSRSSAGPPVQVARARCWRRRRVGAYHHLTAGGRRRIAERARPGPVRRRVAVGGPASALLLRRAFSIYRATPTGRPAAPSRSWSPCTARAPRGWPACGRGDPLDVVGPLGPPVPRCPATPVGCAAGRRRLRRGPAVRPGRARCAAAGCRVDFVLGAATADRLFGVLEAKRMAGDGRRHHRRRLRRARGRVTDVLPDVLDAAAAPTSSTPAARWRCCARSPRSPPPHGRALPGARSRSRWPAASASA